MLLGVTVNAMAIVLGALLGARIGGAIPERHSELVMSGIKMIILSLGISFAIKTEHILVVIISIVVGALIGESINIDARMKRFSDRMTGRFQSGAGGSSFSTAFVTASLVFCVGSMAILAGLESGMEGRHTIHFTKGIIDGIAALFFASTLGVGVAASGVAVFIYQGLITVFASFVAPFVTTEIITEVSATGGIMLMALAFSMLNLIKVKVANMTPALIFPVLMLLMMARFENIFG